MSEAEIPKTPLLEIRDLSKTYQIRQGVFRKPLELKAVTEASLSLDRGSTLGIVGESGCGKTTLSRMIVGTMQPTSGSIRLDGQELTSLRGSHREKTLKHVQMVFQSPYNSLNPRLKIADIVREPLDIHRKDLSRAERETRAQDMLTQVGLGGELAKRLPNQLSGGQQQRVGIARALISEARLVICDEPVSALDVSVQAQILNLLRALQGSLGVSYIFVSHDLAVVSNIADQLAVMYLGRIVEYGDAGDVLHRPRHPYTQALVGSAYSPDPAFEKQRKFQVLTGDIPKPTDPPSGCAFRTRCPKAQPLCAQSTPTLASDRDQSHKAACHFLGDSP